MPAPFTAVAATVEDSYTQEGIEPVTVPETARAMTIEESYTQEGIEPVTLRETARAMTIDDSCTQEGIEPVTLRETARAMTIDDSSTQEGIEPVTIRETAKPWTVRGSCSGQVVGNEPAAAGNETMHPDTVDDYCSPDGIEPVTISETAMPVTVSGSCAIQERATGNVTMHPQTVNDYCSPDGIEPVTIATTLPGGGVSLKLTSSMLTGIESEFPVHTISDQFCVLIASDFHIGYKDREPLVSEDSLRTFEEVLRLAKAKNADMLLTAGDFFHMNRPSRNTWNGAVELMQKYCLGSRPVCMRFLSNPAENFPSADKAFQIPNWEDPNINIDLPIFTIHGNHDDPIGVKNLGEMDSLHTQRLVNYIGKPTDLSNIVVAPVLLQKGDTFIALYGLGSVKDERLNHMFRDNRVRFVRPTALRTQEGRVVEAKDMFSILLFHQNRVQRGPNNYIPESYLPEWIDLVVWGHEHDCIPLARQNPAFKEKNENFKRYVLQPGSTIATSMIEGESQPKHAFMLRLSGREWIIEPIRLRSVRPFYIRDVDLSRRRFRDDIEIEVQVMQHLTNVVESCIAEAESSHEAARLTPKEPLVRIRVNYGSCAPVNQKRFGQRFLGRIACPDDILLPLRKKKQGVDSSLTHDTTFSVKNWVLSTNSIDDSIREYIHGKKETLYMQDLSLFLESLRLQIDKEDRSAVREMLKYQDNLGRNYLLDPKITPIDEMSKKLDECVTSRKFDLDREMVKFQKWRRAVTAGTDVTSRGDASEQPTTAMSSSAKLPPTRGRGRGRGRGRASAAAQAPSKRATTASSRHTDAGDRAAADDVICLDDSDSDSDVMSVLSRRSTARSTASSAKRGRKRVAK